MTGPSLPPEIVALLIEQMSRPDATRTRDQPVPEVSFPKTKVNPFLLKQGISQELVDSLAAIPVSRDSGMARGDSRALVDTTRGDDRISIFPGGQVGEVLGRFRPEADRVEMTPRRIFGGVDSPRDQERTLIHEFGHRTTGPFERQANLFLEEFSDESGRTRSVSPRHQSNVMDDEARGAVRDSIRAGLGRLTEEQERQQQLRDLLSHER